MTVETPAAFDIPNTSPAGFGLTVPIAKALAHLMIVHEACHQSWSIAADTARGEIQEAATHLGDLFFGNDLMTEGLREEIRTWVTDIAEFSRDLRNNALPEEGALSDEDLTTLRDIVTQTWALLTLIDREIVGLPNAMTDPGDRP